MQFPATPSILVAARAAVATPCRPAPSCNPDACLSDLLLNPLVAKDDCRSNLLATVSPTVSVVYETITATFISTDLLSITATDTTFVEATNIVSEVETDVVDYTTTIVQSDIQTTTEEAVVTVTESNSSPSKRDFAVQLPKGAPGCTVDAQYISACSCLGIFPVTPTPTASLSTSYITAIATESADVISTTVQTVPFTVTTSTAIVTETFSTEIVSQPIETVTNVVTYSTETIVSTSTDSVPASTPTLRFQLQASGSGDPTLDGGMGYGQAESFRGSTTVYYTDFGPDATVAQQFGYVVTGNEWNQLIQVTGPGQSAGEGMYYSTFGGAAPASYVNICSESFAASQGGTATQCKLDNNNYLQCQWDSPDNLADFWTCRGRLNLVRPGYDFTGACEDASTSYKISIQAINIVQP